MQSVFDTLLSSYNVVYGSGIADYVARWVTDSTLGTGLFRDDGIGTAIGMTPNSTYALRINGSVYFRDDGNAIYSNSGNYFCPECSTNRMEFYNGIGAIRFIKPSGNSVQFYKDNATSANLVYEFTDNDVEVNNGVGFSDRTLPDNYSFLPRTASGAWPGTGRTQIWAGARIDNILNSRGLAANSTWTIYDGADSTTVLDYELNKGLTVYEGNLAVGSNSDTYSLELNTTDAALMPDGTTAQRPTGTAGLFRYNTDNAWFEGHNGTTWATFVKGSGTAGTPVEWSGTNTVTNVSLTAGSVLFADAGAGLGQDNANLFWDDTNNRLGIGTNSPSHRIHATKTSTATAYEQGSYLFQVTRTPSGATPAGTNIGGLASYMTTSGTNDMGRIFVTNSNLEVTSAANFELASGGYFGVTQYTSNAAATVDTLVGISIDNAIDGANIGQAYGLSQSNIFYQGTHDRSFGIWGYTGVDNSATLDTMIMAYFYAEGNANYRYGLYLEEPTGSGLTKDYAIYATNNAMSYFAGNIGIGSDPSYVLDMGSRTGGMRTPVGTTAQRPTGAAGVLRYNSTTSLLEFHNGSTWASLAAGAGSMSSWLLNTNSDGTTSITDGEEVGFDGGSGIKTSRSSNDVTIAVSGFHTSFNTYTGDPGTLSPSRGAVWGIDNVTTGWTQTIGTGNLAAGDEFYIIMVNSDGNTQTLDVDGTGTGGFIRPSANGDLNPDDTEAFTGANHYLRLVWDGSNFWIFE